MLGRRLDCPLLKQPNIHTIHQIKNTFKSKLFMNRHLNFIVIKTIIMIELNHDQSII